LKIHLLTSGITEAGSPHAEEVLREAKKLGVRYYRLGFMDFKPDASESKQLDVIKEKLKELGTLNAKLGVVGMLQNHSPGGRSYVGGELGQMYQIVKDLNPEQIGVAFDIGHALAVHGRAWRPYFEKLKGHLKVAYIKDRKLGGNWVPFGEGEIPRTDYFKALKALNYNAPFSLHIEFDWDKQGKNRASLLAALKQSATVLSSWIQTMK
jgi:sugar phosphate isomerase/epimerase